MGYTPLFDTLTKGTLCGKWPDIGLWPIVLSMADKNGVIDATPAYIAGVTGLAVDEVVACMARFCEPDPYSRSQEANGARLRLVDEHRQWGWLVVNHSKYREKARKQMHDVRRQETGENAERMRERHVTRDDPTGPDGTRDNPLSNANAYTEEEKRPRERGSRLPADWHAGPELIAWARDKRPDLDVAEELEKFRDYYLAKTGKDAAKLDWTRTFRNWIRNARVTNGGARKPVVDDGVYT